MSQLKAGDLALVIFTKHTPNIGKCVTLESRHKLAANDTLPINNSEMRFLGRVREAGVYWKISGDLCMHLVSTDTGEDKGYTNVPYTYLLERNLMPLKGNLEVTKVTEELVLVE